MEASFACPECGTSVEVHSLAPGRQVRCGFCNRLLEVPYLPRAADSPWKRRRFARPKWLPWVWAGSAIVVIAIVVAGGARLIQRQLSSSQERSINHLVESAHRHEADGALGEALVDLDSAIDMARGAGNSYHDRLEIWSKERAMLARRDAQAIIDQLKKSGPQEFPLGTWLNLLARARLDPDLATLMSAIGHQFETAVDLAVHEQLRAARRRLNPGKPSCHSRCARRLPP